MQTPGGDRGDRSGPTDQWRDRLTAFYQVYNREKLSDVDDILERYKGQVCGWWARWCPRDDGWRGLRARCTVRWLSAVPVPVSSASTMCTSQYVIVGSRVAVAGAGRCRHRRAVAGVVIGVFGLLSGGDAVPPAQ